MSVNGEVMITTNWKPAESSHIQQLQKVLLKSYFPALWESLNLFIYLGIFASIHNPFNIYYTHKKIAPWFSA